jgi:hypothetical protein
VASLKSGACGEAKCRSPFFRFALEVTLTDVDCYKQAITKLGESLDSPVYETGHQAVASWHRSLGS